MSEEPELVSKRSSQSSKLPQKIPQTLIKYQMSSQSLLDYHKSSESSSKKPLDNETKTPQRNSQRSLKPKKSSESSTKKPFDNEAKTSQKNSQKQLKPKRGSESSTKKILDNEVKKAQKNSQRLLKPQRNSESSTKKPLDNEVMSVESGITIVSKRSSRNLKIRQSSPQRLLNPQRSLESSTVKYRDNEVMCVKPEHVAKGSSQSSKTPQKLKYQKSKQSYERIVVSQRISSSSPKSQRSSAKNFEMQQEKNNAHKMIGLHNSINKCLDRSVGELELIREVKTPKKKDQSIDLSIDIKQEDASLELVRVTPTRYEGIMQRTKYDQAEYSLDDSNLPIDTAHHLQTQRKELIHYVTKDSGDCGIHSCEKKPPIYELQKDKETSMLTNNSSSLFDLSAGKKILDRSISNTHHRHVEIPKHHNRSVDNKVISIKERAVVFDVSTETEVEEIVAHMLEREEFLKTHHEKNQHDGTPFTTEPKDLHCSLSFRKDKPEFCMASLESSTLEGIKSYHVDEEESKNTCKKKLTQLRRKVFKFFNASKNTR